MGEIGVQGEVQGESGVAGVEGGVCRCVVFDRGRGEAGDELVCEADALGWTKGVAV